MWNRFVFVDRRCLFFATEIMVSLKDFFDMCIQGASTTCYLAIHPGAKGISGEYWADNNISSPSGFVNDPEFVKKFWDFSVELVDRSLASSSL
ncbi:putative very-long-chain 3-oxoacyl-CoA reductase [Helianthus anomalus]